MSRQVSKYKNKRTERDGVIFASKKEAGRYAELKLLLHEEKIADLVLQPRFKLIVMGELICTYVADFQYFDRGENEQIIEDVKSAGTRTSVYRIKKKLLHAIYGIDIHEID